MEFWKKNQLIFMKVSKKYIHLPKTNTYQTNQIKVQKSNVFNILLQSF